MITLTINGQAVTVEKDTAPPLPPGVSHLRATSPLACAMVDRIAELEGQLAAVGAGGVTAGVPLLARAEPFDLLDAVARGVGWAECETLMREACEQAGVEWGEEKKPQPIAINVMQRLANNAHKEGYKLAIKRSAELAADGDLFRRAVTAMVNDDPRFIENMGRIAGAREGDDPPTLGEVRTMLLEALA